MTQTQVARTKYKMASSKTVPKVQAASVGGALGVVAAQIVTYLLEVLGVTLAQEVEMALVTLAAAGLAWIFGRLKRPNGSENVVVDHG